MTSSLQLFPHLTHFSSKLEEPVDKGFLQKVFTVSPPLWTSDLTNTWLLEHFIKSQRSLLNCHWNNYWNLLKTWLNFTLEPEHTNSYSSFKGVWTNADVHILHSWRVNNNFIDLSITASDPNMPSIKNVLLIKDSPVFLFCCLFFLCKGLDMLQAYILL